MSYRAEIAAMLRAMPSGWRRQYAVGRDTLARNGGPVLPDAPTPDQVMRILGNTAGGKADADTAAGDQPVPKAVRDAAMHGLRLSYTNNYGGWEFFGIARAIQLALMPSVPLRTRERMVRYLSDHARDKAGRSFGDERHPSNGYMAWLNWGGDPAVAWNERDGIGRATYGAAARRTNGVKTAAVEAAAKLGAKVGIKGGGRFVPIVGEALMAIDVAREGHSLYKRRKAGEQIGWKEGTLSLASSAIIGPEGVAWAKKKIEARKAKKNPRDLRGRFIPPRYLAGLSPAMKKQRIAELTTSRDAYGTGDFSELPSDRIARAQGLVRMSPYSREARAREIEWRGDTEDMAARVLAYYGLRSGQSALSNALRQSYARGLAAWKSGGHRPGATARNWADARVHSFVTGGKTTWTGDADLFRALPKSIQAAIEAERA